MTRKEFVKLCGILGVGMPFTSLLSSCKGSGPMTTNFSGKVIIVGAGAGGLSAGYLLKQLGVDFEILEASSTYGGRIKRTTDFADFPIPLGAEWIHTKTNIFQEMVNNADVQVNVETTGYDPSIDTVAYWQNGELEVNQLRDQDLKFVDSTWFDFYEQYIVPSISSAISYNQIVESVNYEGDQIIIKTLDAELTADKVIINVPVKILQEGDITFTPAFPVSKSNAINDINVWHGFKAFFEFDEQFYHTITAFNIEPEEDGQKLYYDAAYGQKTAKHIMGLFCVGKPALDLINRSGDELRDFMLAELDQIYDGKATPAYVKHIVQNWNNEPFIKGAYPTDHEDWRSIRTLGQSIADKIYFVGTAYTDGSDWSSVHTAADSAKTAVWELAS